MVSTVLTKQNIAGNAIKNHYDEEYTMESCVLKNGGLGAYTDLEVAGMPVVVAAGVATLVEDGLVGADQTDANGIVATKGRVTLATTVETVEKYVVLVRGPAVIWSNGIAAEDGLGVAIVAATIATALAAESPPIITAVGGGALVEEQTT